jgi:hypothetical protein
MNATNRNKFVAGIAALTGIAALPALPATQAVAQFGGPNPYGFQGRRPFQGGRPQVIPWSFASSRPSVPNGRATGLFIWHDRNTVHVDSTDNHWFGDDIQGFIEIEGGSFDNVQNTHDRDDTRYHVIGKNRIAFHFNAKDREVDGFKFNIHDGKRLIFHIGLNGRRTGSIYYGESMTPSGEDPVVFNLKK